MVRPKPQRPATDDWLGWVPGENVEGGRRRNRHVLIDFCEYTMYGIVRRIKYPEDQQGWVLLSTLVYSVLHWRRGDDSITQATGELAS